MKKLVTLNIGVILTLTMLFSVIYYILLVNNFLSISSIIANTHHLAIKKHLLVLGLLPIYIAAMIFGTALLGTYLGSTLQDRIGRNFKDKPFLMGHKHFIKK